MMNLQGAGYMDYSEHMKIAYEATKRGDNSLARQVLEEILSSNADIEPAWYLYAHIATNRADAIHSLKQVLELNPSHGRARQELDRLLNSQDQQPVFEGVKTLSPLIIPKLNQNSNQSIILWGLVGLACFILIFGTLFIFVKYSF
jgi:hypothetical protein